MRTQSKAAAVALDAYFETPSNYAHAANLAGQPATDLVLERLPSGELAWLRSEDRGEPDDALYVLTDAGRRALAEAQLFNHRVARRVLHRKLAGSRATQACREGTFQYAGGASRHVGMLRPVGSHTIWPARNVSSQLSSP